MAQHREPSLYVSENAKRTLHETFQDKIGGTCTAKHKNKAVMVKALELLHNAKDPNSSSANTFSAVTAGAKIFVYFPRHRA